MTDKITLTRALTELKHLSASISRTNTAAFVSFTKGEGDHLVTANGTALAALTSSLQANLQSATDKITRLADLKNKIAVANATIKVKVAGQEMTIAEAVAMKNVVIPAKKELLAALKLQLQRTNDAVAAGNNRLDAEIEAAIRNLAGNEKAMKGFGEEEYNAQALPRKKRGQHAILDPNNLSAVITTMEKEIDDFLQEVDIALSEANSTNTIEV